MDAADLKVFETVARVGGITRAASVLNTVQSNVTARVRFLEEELGVPLFHRHSRGVTLTAAGQRLLPYATRVGQLLAEARRAVEDDGKPKGLLTLGSLETAAALRLPAILAGYAGAYPEVDLVLRTGTTQFLIDKVLRHEIEGAFVAGPVDHPDLDEEAVFREELVVVTARSIRRLDELTRISDLKILVFRAGCSYRQRLEAVLASRGIVGLRQLEFGTLEAILGCAAAGIGISLLPRGVVKAAARDGRVALHALPPEEAEVETMFVRRQGAFVSSALDCFLRCARSRPVLLPANAAE
jgi:LysR family transcriptional regulator, cell division regulator